MQNAAQASDSQMLTYLTVKYFIGFTSRLRMITWKIFHLVAHQSCSITGCLKSTLEIRWQLGLGEQNKAKRGCVTHILKTSA